MRETRYFIYNHAAAFARCTLDGLRQEGDMLTLAHDDPHGRLVTPVMDSGQSGNLWQRVLADISLPDGTRVGWTLVASDSEAECCTRLPAQPVHGFSAENTADFIPIGLRGRYAVAVCMLSGGDTPAVMRSLCVYAAWESFLQYLPEIFREEGSFLDRYLRLFSAPFLELEQQIGALSGALDPAVAPNDLLPFLSDTMGISHGRLWDADGLRALLKTGVFRKKGRLSAVFELVELFTGFRPYLVEHFRMHRGEPQNDRLYDDCELLIILPYGAAGANLNRRALNRLLVQFLPAGITFRIQVLDESALLGGHTYLGINTRLGRYSQAKLGQNSRLNLTVMGGTAKEGDPNG